MPHKLLLYHHLSTAISNEGFASSPLPQVRQRRRGPSSGQVQSGTKVMPVAFFLHHIITGSLTNIVKRVSSHRYSFTELFRVRSTPNKGRAVMREATWDLE